jgi:hypothetical protein
MMRAMMHIRIYVSPWHIASFPKTISFPVWVCTCDLLMVNGIDRHKDGPIDQDGYIPIIIYLLQHHGSSSTLAILSSGSTRALLPLVASTL